MNAQTTDPQDNSTSWYTELPERRHRLSKKKPQTKQREKSQNNNTNPPKKKPLRQPVHISQLPEQLS
jgi:hypothetical protein